MQLDPSTYRCPDHDNSAYLTTAVRTELGSGEVILTERAPENVFKLFGRTDGGAFKVMVNCPGPTDNPAPHPLVFEGKWRE